MTDRRTSGKKSRVIMTDGGQVIEEDNDSNYEAQSRARGKSTELNEVIKENKIRESFESVDSDDDGWVPYENKHGKNGWMNLENGDTVFDDNPPDSFENISSTREINSDNPLKEGEKVRYETSDGYEYGEVYQVNNGQATIIQNRGGTIRVGEDGSGPREINGLDTPYSEKLDPEELTPETQEDVGFLLSEADDLEEEAKYIRESLEAGVDVDDVSAAVEENNDAWGVLSNELLSNPTENGSIALKPELVSSDDKLEEEFREEHGEEVEQDVEKIVRGWEGAMFERRSAGLIEHAKQESLNEQTPGYNTPDSLRAEEVEAAEKHSEFVSEKLREEFGDSITVYRGLTTSSASYQADGASETPEQLREAKENNEEATMPHRAVESWSTDPYVASTYAMSSDEDDTGVVIEREVDVDKVHLSASTGHLLDDDAEIVVGHEEQHTYEPEQIYKEEDLTGKQKFEMVLSSIQDINNED